MGGGNPLSGLSSGAGGLPGATTPSGLSGVPGSGQACPGAGSIRLRRLHGVWLRDPVRQGLFRREPPSGVAGYGFSGAAGPVAGAASAAPPRCLRGWLPRVHTLPCQLLELLAALRRVRRALAG